MTAGGATGTVEAGTQIERTILARSRTHLALVVAAFLIVRLAAPGGERAVTAVVCAAAVAGASIAGLHRQHRLRAGVGEAASAARAAAIALAVAVLVLQAVAVGVIARHRPATHLVGNVPVALSAG